MSLTHVPGVLAALLTGTVALADTQARYDAVKSLGSLNGVALQCKYLDQVARIKQAIVESVPKERSYGLAFEQATNDSFLGFIREKGSCPGPAGFERTVAESIQQMQQLFSSD
jgi:hypothetical protein